MQHQLHFTRGQPDDEAIRWIQMWEGTALERDPRGYCVCTSEGKDSRVVGHLMRRAGVKHFYINNITGIDPPELVYFRRKNFEQYRAEGYTALAIPYRESMWQLMREHLAPPLRRMRYCCEHFKERVSPEQENAIISLGVRKHESTRRAMNRDELEFAIGRDVIKMAFDNDSDNETMENCYSRRELRVNPIANWTTEMVWDYSADVGLEQCSLYQEGFDRLGCIGCPMARYAGRRMEFDRWPAFEAQYIRTFDWMREERIRRGKVITHDSGQDWFDWWMSDKAQEIMDEDQLMLEDTP